MNLQRWHLALAVVAPLGAARAQSPAKAELYTRTADGVVRAAIPIELEPGWHIYHGDLGHPKAIGQPTTVTFLGDGIRWSDVRFPEPIRIDQSDVGGPGVFILAHEGRTVLYAAGRLAPGSSEADLHVKVKGLVCQKTCMPFKQELTSKGAGDDALFAAFPADLLPPAAAADEASGTSPPAASAAPAPAQTAQITASAAETPREDVRGSGGHADATLYTRVEGRELRVALQIAIDPGWHLYHTADDLGKDAVGKPTSIQLKGPGVSFEKPLFPQPKRVDQSDIGGPGAYINAHEGTIVVYARGALEAGASGEGISAELKGQTCNPQVCVDYKETAFSRGRGADEVWAGFERASAGAAPSVAAPATSAAPAEAAVASAAPEEQSLLLFLLLAVGGGLFALVMPCTYPMIPITISFFTKQAEKRGGNAIKLSLAYGAGIVLIFVVVGVLFGSLIKPFASSPITNLVLGLAFVYFALVLFGALNLQPPRALMNVAGTASMKGGYVGVFLMGATLVVTSFTCTAPFVGSLLSIGASGGSAARVALGMTVFGLTMAVPFVLLSLVPGRLKAIPRSGEWMNTVKVTLGFVELAAALKFISNADLVWHWGWLSRELFLFLWVGIFGVAALYLFGLIHVKSTQSEISPGRMLVGLAFVLLGLYCWSGATGSAMDPVMTAILPNYTNRVASAGEAAARTHTIVKDDYQAARQRAAAEGKLLLVNFTGYT